MSAHHREDPPAREQFEIRALRQSEADAVPVMWNAAWGGEDRNPYPLSHGLWDERLESRHHDPSLLLGAFAGGQLVGVAYGKLPRSHWQPPNGGWVSLLAVVPAFQGRGLGTRLTAHLLSLLAQRGASAVRFGGDADHLLPGPPQESGAATWRLLRRFGASFGGAEHDLHLDLRSPLPEAPLPAGWRLRLDDPQLAAATTNELFPGRWAEEVNDYVAAGVTPLILERDGEDAAADPALAQGFCVIFQGGERLTSPGLLWASALGRELESTRQRPVALGAIGPLGIAAEARGAGVGLAMVRAAAQHLKDNGVTDVIINWTGLTKFYGRLGARLWRSYQHTQAAMPPHETLLALSKERG